MTGKATVDFGVCPDTKNKHSRSSSSLFVTQRYAKRYLGLPEGLILT